MSYTIDVKTDIRGILGSIETEDPEYEEPNLDAPDTGTIFKTQTDKINNTAAKTYGEQTRDYYLADSLIRLDRSNKIYGDEFILIAPSAKKMKTYYMSHNNKPTYTESRLSSEFVDSTLVFEIDTFLKDTKKIHGYDCYKIDIIQGKKKADNDLIRVSSDYA